MNIQIRWSPELVERLIYLRGTKYAALFDQRGYNNNASWIKIQRELNVFTTQQVRKKWQNLVHKYKEVLKDEDEAEIRWPYFDSMHNIFQRGDIKPYAFDTSLLEPNIQLMEGDDETSADSREEKLTLTHLPELSIHNAISLKNQPEFLIKLPKQQKNIGENNSSNLFNENDVIIPPLKKAKVTDNGVSSYERERDRVLINQNNVIISLLKAFLEKDGIIVESPNFDTSFLDA